MVDSPRGHTAGGGPRPSSGKVKAVQLLLDAVRSKDDAQLAEVLDYLKMPNGGTAGVSRVGDDAQAECGCI